MRNNSLLVLLLTTAAAAQQQPAEEKPARIEGIVTNALTGEPLLRAHILCDGFAAGKQQQFGAMTTAEGKFSITGLPAGNYNLTAERVGFIPPLESGRRGMSVLLRPGDSKSDVKLKLTPTGAILGRVVNADGDPVEGASVSAEIGGTSMSRSAGAITDQKGQFRIGGLAPGRYRVKAVPGTLPFPPEIRNGRREQAHEIPTFHPNTFESKAATRVEVKSAADVTGVDIKLQRVPFVRLSGVVTGIPAGTPSQNVRVEVRNGFSIASRTVSAVAPDGKFEVWNVEPGPWQVSAVSYARDQALRSAAIELEVGGQHLDNLELRLLAAFDVSGQLEFEDDSARPHPPAQGGPPPRMALQDVNRGPSSQPVIPAADGTFKFAAMQPGKYRLITGWRASIKSIRLGQTVMEGGIVDLSNGASGVPLTIVLGPASAEVTGTVRDEKGPAAGVGVLLARPEITTTTSNSVFSTVTAADGTFRLANVPDGKYILFAADENDAALLAGNYEDYEEILANVELRAGEKIAKELKRRPRAR